ncbi:MAG: hypothetical protein MUE82_09675 [Chloroflexi bacterium]|jgi:hypothetical protein|nr:hypothetical protein [Chloroflexota bacterium]
MKRTLLTAFLATILATVVAPTASAATTTAKWTASFGSKGAVTLSLLDTGAGTLQSALKSIPKSAVVLVTVSAGTCASGTTITSQAGRSTSAGKYAKRSSVTAYGMSDVLGSMSLVVKVRAGTWSKCAALKGGPPIAAGSFGAGTKLVGTDITPGTYRIRFPVDGCYWERLTGLGGTLDEILANDIVTGYAVVTIAPTDVAFTSKRCGIWSPDLSAVTPTRTAFGEGTFIVGTDMQPGRYRSSGEGSCYWERLSGFSGTLDDIISNDNVDGQAIVDIAGTDAGFSSSRCGAWTLVQ